jgi:propanol-preferring alcohol dehydrogenase
MTAGIHMSDIPSFPYSILGGKRTGQSVANLTRQANETLAQLRSGELQGAAALTS